MAGRAGGRVAYLHGAVGLQHACCSTFGEATDHVLWRGGKVGCAPPSLGLAWATAPEIAWPSPPPYLRLFPASRREHVNQIERGEGGKSNTSEQRTPQGEGMPPAPRANEDEEFRGDGTARPKGPADRARPARQVKCQYSPAQNERPGSARPAPCRAGPEATSRTA